MWLSRAMLVPASIAAALVSTPAIAQLGLWGGPDLSGYSPGRSSDPREGRVQVSRYVASASAAASLGHGPIAVAVAPGGLSMGSENAIYEAAIVDRLVRAGYQSQVPGQASQLAELRIAHSVVEPPEPPRSPVSGSVNVGVGSYGTSAGAAIAIDMSKPATALISTRLDASIRDKATDALLWEGHAKVLTRVGDRDWTTAKTADRLAAALFENFPQSATPVGAPATGRR